MILRAALVSVSLLGLLAACGGAGGPTEVPEALPAGASSADIGDHIVHFSAQSTDQLPPLVAREYNIVRSKDRAMLNVSVIRKEDNLPVPAEIKVKTVNLTSQLKNVTMRRIDEAGPTAAIYYIGETPVANREWLIFDISVKPEGVILPTNVRFKKQFYTD
ncbi:MAG: DUF4426 domain-containing protein [Proteobacteria bacterium]|nr:DUF4426 domain-containing protein [Pseudomonadota bacterium]